MLLSKVQRFSPLKAWGTRLVGRLGAKKARVAVAHKIAVILRSIWTDGTEFWWAPRWPNALYHPGSAPAEKLSLSERWVAATAQCPLASLACHA